MVFKNSTSPALTTPEIQAVEAQTQSQLPTHSRLSSENESNEQPSLIESKKIQNNVTDRTNTFSGKGDNQTNLRRGQSNKRKLLLQHERYMESQKLMENMLTRKQYTKYYIIKSDSEENLAETNVIRANIQLNEALGGTPQNISKLRNGTLLLEVRNKIQSHNMLKLRSLNDISVKVEAHSRLNCV